MPYQAGRADRDSGEQLSWVRDLPATREEATVVIKEGKAEEVIAAEIAVTGSQMLVMGAYGHSAWRGSSRAAPPPT